MLLTLFSVPAAFRSQPSAPATEADDEDALLADLSEFWLGPGHWQCRIVPKFVRVFFQELG